MAIVALVATVVSSFVANAVGPVRPLAIPSLAPVVPPVLADTARFDGLAAQLAKFEENLEAKLEAIEARLEARIGALEQ